MQLFSMLLMTWHRKHLCQRPFTYQIFADEKKHHLYDEEVHQLPHHIEYERCPKDPEDSRWLLSCQVCLASSPKHAPPGVPNHLWHWRIPVCKQCQARQQMDEHTAPPHATELEIPRFTCQGGHHKTCHRCMECESSEGQQQARLIECSVDPNTHALCHAMRAAASGPSAKAYTIAPILAL